MSSTKLFESTKSLLIASRLEVLMVVGISTNEKFYKIELCSWELSAILKVQFNLATHFDSK